MLVELTFKVRVQLSSGTANKKQAIKILEKWYDRLQFQKDEGIQVHTKTFAECLKQYEKSLETDISRTTVTIKGIRQKFNTIKQCKGIMKLDINKVNIESVKNTFLKWRLDREKVINRQATETVVSAYGKDFLSQLERYYLTVNVGKSKTVPHTAYGTGSAYFAYQNLIKLYSNYPQFNSKVGEGTIFKLHSFREGLNALLDEADLKFEKLGDSRVKRDSKSFRHTFIQFMLNKGMGSTAIAKMCGTSTEMIDKFYTSNIALDTMMDTFNKVKGGYLKVVE